MECAITVGLPVKLRCIRQPCCSGSCALMNVVVNENSVLLVKIPAIERCPEHVFYVFATVGHYYTHRLSFIPQF